MAGGGGGGGESGEPEFQIAPMIDVLLVLLIFFMCITSAEVLKVDKEITLPVSPNAKERDPEMAKHEIAINVRWDDA
jgi:biopolymer transport protein ExbD